MGHFSHTANGSCKCLPRNLFIVCIPLGIVRAKERGRDDLIEKQVRILFVKNLSLHKGVSDSYWCTYWQSDLKWRTPSMMFLWECCWRREHTISPAVQMSTCQYICSIQCIDPFDFLKWSFLHLPLGFLINFVWLQTLFISCQITINNIQLFSPHSKSFDSANQTMIMDHQHQYYFWELVWKAESKGPALNIMKQNLHFIYVL